MTSSVSSQRRLFMRVSINECNPVIAQVKNPTTGHNHFVILTGQGDNTYNIVDPGYKGRTTLESYSNQILGIRTVKKDPPPYPGVLEIHIGPPQPGIDIAEFFVIDPNGKKTGYDPAINKIVDESPSGSYDTEEIGDLETGETGVGPIKEFYDNNATNGEYKMIVVGKFMGKFGIDISGLDINGNDIPNIDVDYYTAPTYRDTFIINYSKEPNVSMTLTRLVDFSIAKRDIELMYEVGCNDNQGVMESLLQKLENAEKAMNHFNTLAYQKTPPEPQAFFDAKTAMENMIDAFINEVNAQKGKHIQDRCAQILVEDAKYLLENRGSLKPMKKGFGFELKQPSK